MLFDWNSTPHPPSGFRDTVNVKFWSLSSILWNHTTLKRKKSTTFYQYYSCLWPPVNELPTRVSWQEKYHMKCDPRNPPLSCQSPMSCCTSRLEFSAVECREMLPSIWVAYIKRLMDHVHLSLAFRFRKNKNNFLMLISTDFNMKAKQEL